MKFVSLCIASIAGLASAGDALAFRAYGFVPPATLSYFDTASPAIVTSQGVVGIPAGEAVVGIDFRPVDGQLYALTRDASGVGRLYRIALPATAVFVGTLTADPADLTNPYSGLPTGNYGVDFNPVSDRLRVVGSSGLNVRVNPANALVVTDANLNPGAPNVTAVAYANSLAGTTTTALYAIDVATDTLNLQSPPNNGTLLPVGTGFGLNATNAQFDIVTAGANYAFAALNVGGTTALYSIDLVTGTATSIATIGANFGVNGLSIRPEVVFLNGFE